MPIISDLLPNNTEVTELTAKYTTKSLLGTYKLSENEKGRQRENKRGGIKM
jgi:hypothetical protein